MLALLNSYLASMVEILQDDGAIINEIIGDGILAFYGAPDPVNDHPARAVACALKMQLAMDAINSGNIRKGLPTLEMGIGVNTGDVGGREYRLGATSEIRRGRLGGKFHQSRGILHRGRAGFDHQRHL